MTEKTKHIPKTGTYKVFPLNTHIHEAKPPNASDPVSPINTEAGCTLNNKYASKLPIKQKDVNTKLDEPFCKSITTPISPKKGTLVPAASPSNPSVKLTAFTVAKNTKTVTGIIHQEIEKALFTKGRYNRVIPAR